MKSQAKRDEQAVTIATALPLVAVVGVVGWVIVSAAGAGAGVLLAGLALAALGLARRRSR